MVGLVVWKFDLSSWPAFWPTREPRLGTPSPWGVQICTFETLFLKLRRRPRAPPSSVYPKSLQSSGLVWSSYWVPLRNLQSPVLSVLSPVRRYAGIFRLKAKKIQSIKPSSVPSKQWITQQPKLHLFFNQYEWRWERWERTPRTPWASWAS